MAGELHGLTGFTTAANEPENWEVCFMRCNAEVWERLDFSMDLRNGYELVRNSTYYRRRTQVEVPPGFSVRREGGGFSLRCPDGEDFHFIAMPTEGDLMKRKVIVSVMTQIVRDNRVL